MELPMTARYGPLGRPSVFKELGVDDDGPGDWGLPLHPTLIASCFVLPTASNPSPLPSAISSPISSPTSSTIPSTKYSTDSTSISPSTFASNSTDLTSARSRSSTIPVKRPVVHRRWYSRAFNYLTTDRPRARSAPSVYPSVPPSALPTLTHVVMLMILFVLILPGVQLSIPFGAFGRLQSGVEAAVIPSRTPEESLSGPRSRLEARDDSPTDACLRFSQQSAVVNRTLYLYGGHATSREGQQDDTWTNNFLALDLSESFATGTPNLRGLPKPDGPPPVANGYLWHSYTSLYLYGGLFSDSPPTTPEPFSLWEYDLIASSWKEHKDPKTSAGNNSEPGGVPVQRAAEGAGVSVPEIGRGWYFSGHLDEFTTPGWSKQTPRAYLKSFIEFTFPGAKNDGVEDLADGKTAGEEGVWRNVTEGGLQDTAGFTNRADGILLYVPGFGRQGILIALAGGTNATYTQMNVIDVYDIATSSWFKQATAGETPKIRVNPCAVVAAAADGTSYNVYMYGGQNLLPYRAQTQYNDMWILSLPSFRWIKVDIPEDEMNPPARAGHTCNVWDGQMIVVGGYVGPDLSCDSPGVYVFDMSELKWETKFTARTGGNDQDQHASQRQQSEDTNQIGLSGSYGYRVPAPVRSVIGGHESGGATLTTPVETATSGPIATGKPATFTVTQDGAVVTQTGQADPSPASNGKSGPNIGAIVAGVLAGVLGIAAGYFAFCAWIYRKQLALYKNHVAMSQRAAMASGEKRGYMGVPPHSSAGSTRPAMSSTDEPIGVAASSSAGPQSVTTHPRGADARGSANSSTEDLMAGQEPTFLGVLLSPRRSLRVINRD